MTVLRPLPTDDADRRKAANVRTALSLAAIALVFFFGIILTEYLGGPLVALGVIGSAVLLFLIVAIGRNLGK